MCYYFFLASLERQEQAASPCQPRLGPGPAPRRRPHKKRPIYKVAPLIVSTTKRAAPVTLPLTAAPAESRNKEESEKKQDLRSLNNNRISSEVPVLPPQHNPVTVSSTSVSLLNQLRESSQLEVICML